MSLSGSGESVRVGQDIDRSFRVFVGAEFGGHFVGFQNVACYSTGRGPHLGGEGGSVGKIYDMGAFM